MADSERTDPTPRLVFGLIGDLAQAFPDGKIKQYLLVEWIANELRIKGRYSGATRQVQKWAREVRGGVYAMQIGAYRVVNSNTGLQRPKLDSCCNVFI